MKFYLGTHRVNWLGLEALKGVPLFISHNALRKYKKMPKAVTGWALDSGGFTQLMKNPNGWPKGCELEYIDAVDRYSEAGKLEWAAQQDWMCEPHMLKGRTVREHQHRTVQNYLNLTTLAPDLPWVPSVQGFTVDEYHYCIDLFASAGVDLTQLPVVAIGSVCKRQGSDEILEVVSSVAGRGIRLHGFGVKTKGMALLSEHLVSSDSLAWSYRARNADQLPGCTHKGNCANCPIFALQWRRKVLERIA